MNVYISAQRYQKLVELCVIITHWERPRPK